MAETITYEVGIQPRIAEVSETVREGASKDFVILSTTNVVAIRLLLTKIKAGVDVSSVVTAINAL